MAEITYREAVRAALDEEMVRDQNVFVMGEEVGLFKGSYKVTEGLLDKFGEKRVVDTPISEAGFSGLGIGAAMMGLRPVVEFMFFSFVYVAFDQVFNNAPNIRYMSGGLIKCPIVFRGPSNGGTNVGATHSQTIENFAAYTPGLKVVCPATAYDAKGLLKAAVRDNDPVCFLENTILYNTKSDVPDEEYVIPMGVADVKKEGKDITFVCHGRAVQTCLAAAEHLHDEHDIDVEVLDLRSIRPLDEEAIINSVKKTNRVVVVDENKPFCGTGSQISHLIQEKAFDYLDAPVLRVSAIDAPQIYSMPLEKEQVPNPQRVIKQALTIL